MIRQVQSIGPIGQGPFNADILEVTAARLLSGTGRRRQRRQERGLGGRQERRRCAPGRIP